MLAEFMVKIEFRVYVDDTNENENIQALQRIARQGATVAAREVGMNFRFITDPGAVRCSIERRSKV